MPLDIIVIFAKGALKDSTVTKMQWQTPHNVPEVLIVLQEVLNQDNALQ